MTQILTTKHSVQRRHSWLTAFYCILFFTGHAQTNLVVNPGFEELDVASSPQWNSGEGDFDRYMESWFSPTLGTADVFSTDLSPNYITALPHSNFEPNNWLPRGTQMPRSGKRIIGLKPTRDARREYISIPLSCPLIAGEEYYAEMYVSLSEQTNYAQNNLGMYFSDTMIYVNSYEYLSYTPQIVETAVISDSVNWVKISGTFTASSASRYLLIGCFSKESDNTLLYLGNKGENETAYYFVDDVLVQAVNTPAPTLSISGDTALCRNDTLTLTATSNEPVQWYNASGVLISNNPVLKVVPAASTYYEVRSSNCYASTLEIQDILLQDPQTIFLGNDTLICEGTSVLLTVPGLTDYEWTTVSSPGSGAITTSSVQIDSPGIYELRARDANTCLTRDRIEIGFYPEPFVNLGPDLLTCEISGTLRVNEQEAVSYTWNDGSTDSRFVYTGAGTYWVQLSGICGTQVSDTITITAINMFIPNLITANDDSMNDKLDIQGIETGKGTLNVYNRYGAKVFNDEHYSGDWTARDITEGIYYYEFRYPGCSDRKGWVQVLK